MGRRQRIINIFAKVFFRDEVYISFVYLRSIILVLSNPNYFFIEAR